MGEVTGACVGELDFFSFTFPIGEFEAACIVVPVRVPSRVL